MPSQHLDVKKKFACTATSCCFLFVLFREMSCNTLLRSINLPSKTIRCILVEGVPGAASKPHAAKRANAIGDVDELKSNLIFSKKNLPTSDTSGFRPVPKCFFHRSICELDHFSKFSAKNDKRSGSWGGDFSTLELLCRMSAQNSELLKKWSHFN